MESFEPDVFKNSLLKKTKAEGKSNVKQLNYGSSLLCMKSRGDDLTGMECIRFTSSSTVTSDSSSNRHIA